MSRQKAQVMKEERKHLPFITVDILKANPNSNQSKYPKPDHFQKSPIAPEHRKCSEVRKPLPKS